MITIPIPPEFKRIQASMAKAGQSGIRKATAAALTATAKSVVAAEKAQFRRVLDRPRPFTVNAVCYLPAQWDAKRLRARVYIMDTESAHLATAKYLEPYEFGGVNVLNPKSKALVKPIQQPLDRFGNIPWGTVAKLKGGSAVRNGKAFSWKGRGDIFVGTLRPKGGQPISGVWQRPYKVPVTARRGRGSDKKYGRMGKPNKKTNYTGHFILLIRFTDPHPIAGKNRLHWFDIAEKTLNTDGPAFMREKLSLRIPYLMG